MVALNTRTISRVVLYQRERACCWNRATRAWCYGRFGTATRVREEAEYFKGIKGKPDPKQKKRLASLITEHTQGWSLSLATDPVEQALRSMIPDPG